MDVDAGEVLCVVGESGSGKSVSMLAAMGLIGYPAGCAPTCMRFDGIDLLKLSPARSGGGCVGKDMAMVFQEPMSSLNPCYTVGWQIAETLKAHRQAARRDVRERVDRAARASRHSRAGDAACAPSRTSSPAA